jgi:transcription elongation factor
MPTKSNRKKGGTTVRSRSSKKSPAPTVTPALEAAPTPAPPAINDVRADDEPVLGHFVEVVSGEYKGRYGVFEEVDRSGRGAVVRTRDDDSARIVCDIGDLVPAEAGRR